MADAHRWRFFRAGGFSQVRLERGCDLLHLAQLDQKLWLALSCPVQGVEFDQATLAAIDSDGDGHIRPPELIAAIRWAGARLKDVDALVRGQDVLPLDAIDDDREEGARLLATARHVLATLDKPAATAIGLADLADRGRLLADAGLNGDGVLTVAACADPEVAALLADMLACLGGEPDRGGEMGISRAGAERFYAEAAAWLAWWEAGGSAEVSPLGPATDAAWDALTAVQGKIDDYFARCRLAAFDPRAVEAMNGGEAELRALAGLDLAVELERAAALPLAYVAANRPLPLVAGVNPAWAPALTRLRECCVRPLLGDRETLDEADWGALRQRLAGHAAWRARAVASPVAALGEARLRRCLNGGARAALATLFERDEALRPRVAALDELETLLRYVRDLGRLANNFVAFRDFYTRRAPAIFQAGTLYLDGRACELCVVVADVDKHATLAGQSRVCLVYCECVRGDERMKIAAAFTAGDSLQLMVGRNGVFYDRRGRDWDARIVRIVDHPISIRQAFWQPYRKFGGMLAEQFQKFGVARAQAVEQGAQAAVAAGEGRLTAGKGAEPASAFDVGKFAGIFAAIGLAVGALGTALASLLSGFLDLAWWQMPLAPLGLLLMISGPSMLLAWFKLRARTLGPILDANGWAVNASARINIPFGTALTQLAQLPEGAELAVADPYADKRGTGRWLLLALAAGLLLWGAWRLGMLGQA